MNTLPPGPKLPPLLQLLRWVTSPNEFIAECAARFGDVFTLTLPNSKSVFFSHPAAIREIFTGDPEYLHLKPVNAFLGAVLGENSLLLLDGAKHLRERKLMSPPFHGDRMQAYGELIHSITAQVIEKTPKQTPIATHPQMQEITLEVMLRAVFGMEEGAQLTELREALKTFLDQASKPLPILLAMMFPGHKVRRVLTLTAATRSLAGLPLEVGRALPWGRLIRAAELTDKLLYDEIKKRRAQDLSGRRDILSLLLQAKDETGQSMRDDELHNEMLTLLIAGYETTANSLAWVFYHLLQNPTAHQKLVQELKEAFPAGEVQPERAVKLPYLDAVIKEAMRISPAIPVIGRRLERPMQIGGHALPTKTVVIPAICLTHMREDIWPAPQQFKPERFIDKRANQYEFFPFGGGIRRCLGMAFALYEMKIVLAEIFAKSQVQSVPGVIVKPERRGVNFAPSGGMPVLYV